MDTESKRYYVAGTFAVRQDDTSEGTFKTGAHQLAYLMPGELAAWQLLAALSSITGLPNGALQLWRLDAASDLTTGRAYLDQQPLFVQMVQACDAASLELLETMPYDPGVEPSSKAEGPSKDGRFYFLWVELTLRPGTEHRDRFVTACEALLDTMKQKLPTWRLVAALSTITGPPDTVKHLWQLDDADALLEGMNWFGEDNPDYVELARSCQRQRQELFTSMLYNPLGANDRLSSADKKIRRKVEEWSSKRKGGTNG